MCHLPGIWYDAYDVTSQATAVDGKLPVIWYDAYDVTVITVTHRCRSLHRIQIFKQNSTILINSRPIELLLILEYPSGVGS